MKNLFKTTLFAASLLGAASAASAETLYAKIPFGFFANGTAMPAGTYTIRPLSDIPSVLSFENTDTKSRALVFARAASYATIKPTLPLVFTSGKRTDLISVATSTGSYELSSGLVSSPMKGAVLALSPSK